MGAHAVHVQVFRLLDDAVQRGLVEAPRLLEQQEPVAEDQQTGNVLQTQGFAQGPLVVGVERGEPVLCVPN